MKIFKYNKHLKKELNLKIIDYRRRSGKYIIYRENGKGREYNAYTEDLIYEGEFLNGERNGKGIEFRYDGLIVFEGEFKDGKRNGKGKEYNREGEVIFEGEYRNGKKWNGKGCQYYNGKYYEIQNGKGLVNESDFTGYFYEGEYSNGERNGNGREYNDDFGYEKEFEGEYYKGKRWTGKEYNNDNIVTNELKEGREKNGENIFDFDYSGRLEYEYEGTFINGEKNGIGEERCCETNVIYFGEFKDGERNGKGKEYYENNKNLIFEGEYISNYRLKGKEYLHGKLEYEGEYLLNKKWNGIGFNENGNKIYQIINGNGKVLEYNPNGHLIFEGEYSNGFKLKGIEYNSKGQLKFKGNYLNGKMWDGKIYDYDNKNKIYKLNNGKGNIKLYDIITNKKIFEGEYINGERNGMGKEYNRFDSELEFDGEFLDGRRKKGKEYMNGNLIYDGEFSNNLRDGKGKEYFQNGQLRFKGYYFKGKMWDGKGYTKEKLDSFILKDGKGNMAIFNLYSDNLRYIGECEEGEKNGKGKEYNNIGELVYSGNFSKGKRIGIGYVKEFSQDGNLSYEGQYINGKKEGKGKEYNDDGELIFEGEYKNGKKEGKGKEYNDDGELIFEGEFKNGKREGYGKEFDENGELIYEGEFKNGEKQ